MLQGYADIIRPMVRDTVTLLHKELTYSKHDILVEGANATMLDIDFGIDWFLSKYLAFFQLHYE